MAKKSKRQIKKKTILNSKPPMKSASHRKRKVLVLKNKSKPIRKSKKIRKKKANKKIK